MLQSVLLAIPGANYAVVVWSFIVRWWKPLAIAAALAYTFNAGVKYERRKNQTEQLQAQLAKVTRERDSLKVAGDDANKRLVAMEQEAEQLRSMAHEISPDGDCRLSDGALRELQRIPAD